MSKSAINGQGGLALGAFRERPYPLKAEVRTPALDKDGHQKVDPVTGKPEWQTDTFQQQFTFYEPSLAGLTELADVQFQMKPTIDSETGQVTDFDFKQDRAAYFELVLGEYITPVVDPNDIPASLADAFQQMVEDWEEWSGAKAFLGRAREQIEDEIESEREAGDESTGSGSDQESS